MRHVMILAMFVALAALAARPAGATWSIVAADAETQEIVVASATCLTGFDLKRYLPVIVVGKGGGAAQSYVDSSGQRRLIMWNGFLAGLTAPEIVAQLIALPSSAVHQHGVAETTVGTSATHTGASCGAYHPLCDSGQRAHRQPGHHARRAGLRQHPRRPAGKDDGRDGSGPLDGRRRPLLLRPWQSDRLRLTPTELREVCPRRVSPDLALWRRR
jgi:hypothetical protein